MKVILKEALDNLGNIGEVVKVSPGYARNFLLPRGLAVMADEGNVAQLEHHRRALQAKLNKLKADKETLKKKLEELTLTIRRKVGENDKLYGSVTNQDVQEALKEKGYEIDRKFIDLANPIKQLGAHKVPCTLMEGVVAELNVAVVTEV